MARLRFLIRVALVAALVASTQGLLVIQVAFSLNRTEIAQTLCVNRDRPEIDCDGMCVLMERMAEHAHDHGGEPAEGVLELALSVRSLVPETAALPPAPARAAGPVRAAPTLGPSDGAATGVFRPPRPNGA